MDILSRKDPKNLRQSNMLCFIAGNLSYLITINIYDTFYLVRILENYLIFSLFSIESNSNGGVSIIVRLLFKQFFTVGS